MAYFIQFLYFIVLDGSAKVHERKGKKHVDWKSIENVSGSEYTKNFIKVPFDDVGLLDMLLTYFCVYTKS
jgi:hypothetical protein